MRRKAVRSRRNGSVSRPHSVQLDENGRVPDEGQPHASDATSDGAIGRQHGRSGATPARFTVLPTTPTRFAVLPARTEQERSRADQRGGDRENDQCRRAGEGQHPLEVAAVITAMIGTMRTSTAAVVMSPLTNVPPSPPIAVTPGAPRRDPTAGLHSTPPFARQGSAPSPGCRHLFL